MKDFDRRTMLKFLAAIPLVWSEEVFAKPKSSIDDKVLELKAYLGKNHDVEPIFSHKQFKLDARLMKLRPGGGGAVTEAGYESYKNGHAFLEGCARMPLFLSEHKERFDAASRLFSAPKELIASILWIETKFGELKGSYRPEIVFTSLYVGNYKTDLYDPREQFEHYLRFAEQAAWKALEVSCSLMGAIGPAQFLPKSLNTYALGKNPQDLAESIPNIGNYLENHIARTESSGPRLTSLGALPVLAADDSKGNLLERIQKKEMKDASRIENFPLCHCGVRGSLMDGLRCYNRSTYYFMFVDELTKWAKKNVKAP